jgi:hypothetical protein
MIRIKKFVPALALAALLAGCEAEDDQVRGELTVQPASTELAGEQKVLLLTTEIPSDDAGVDPVVYPLEWSVSDPAVGRISAQSADSAVYTHTGSEAGSNAILVRDRLGREGLATVVWTPAE